MVRYTHSVPHIYWWVKYNVSGKYGILGPYNDEKEANDKAVEELRGAIRFDVIPLNTRNKSAASSKLKAIVLHETKDIGQAMQRVRHKPPERNTDLPTTETVHFL